MAFFFGCVTENVNRLMTFSTTHPFSLYNIIFIINYSLFVHHIFGFHWFTTNDKSIDNPIERKKSMIRNHIFFSNLKL